MAWHLITWHESDGNDCTVYDSVVEAADQDQALDTLAGSLEARMRENGTAWQEDGNVLGYYFDCSEDCSEDCEGHGGTSLREVQTFATEAEAEAQRSRWHSEWVI